MFQAKVIQTVESGRQILECQRIADPGGKSKNCWRRLRSLALDSFSHPENLEHQGSYRKNRECRIVCTALQCLCFLFPDIVSQGVKEGKFWQGQGELFTFTLRASTSDVKQNYFHEKRTFAQDLRKRHRHLRDVLLSDFSSLNSGDPPSPGISRLVSTSLACSSSTISWLSRCCSLSAPCFPLSLLVHSSFMWLPRNQCIFVVVNHTRTNPILMISMIDGSPHGRPHLHVGLTDGPTFMQAPRTIPPL